MTFFNRTPAEVADLEARVLAKDFDASLQYLRRFVNGDPIDQYTVLRALALVSVSEYHG
jgi:hypothetical protein